jgi:phage internal scaffolding protein
MTKKNVIDIRSAYTARERKGFETVGESLTQQHMKEETDIRNIINRYDRTGFISHVARGVAQYGDYSEVNEYREALDLVNNANVAFMQIPAEIREKFNNDAGDFFEFATDPNNIEEMRQMGLAEPAQEDADEPSPSASPAEEAPAPQDS